MYMSVGILFLFLLGAELTYLQRRCAERNGKDYRAPSWCVNISSNRMALRDSYLSRSKKTWQVTSFRFTLEAVNITVVIPRELLLGRSHQKRKNVQH